MARSLQPEDGSEGPGQIAPQRRWAGGSLRTALGLVIALSLTSFVAEGFADRDWRCDLFSHFPAQRAVGTAVCVAVGLAARAPRLAAFSAALALLDLASLAPFWIPDGKSSDSEVVLRGVSLNLRAANENRAGTLAYLQSERADVIAVQEFTPAWRDALRSLEQDYPYTALAPQEGSFGVGLYSRLPLIDATVRRFGDDGLPTLEAGLDLPGDDVSILVAHPPPPMNRFAAAERDRQLQALARHLRRFSGAAVVVGDLNVTPWSPSFRRLLREGELQDGRLGCGLRPTWPARFGDFGIPIDHVLVSHEFEVAEFAAGPDVGSDHRPIRFALRGSGR